MNLRRYNRLLRRGRQAFFSLFFWAILSCCVLGLLLIYSGPRKFNGNLDDEIHIDLSKNYFQSRDEFASGDFLIDNGKCKVPDIDIWNPQARALFKVFPTPICNESAKITEVKNNTVHINESELRKLGFELDDVKCCYHTIHRVAETLEKYTKEADNTYRYSDKCYKLEKVTKPKAGFIKVICKVKTFIPLSSNLYEQFHAVPILPEPKEGSSDDDLAMKLSFWKNRRKRGHDELPPNVLMIGIDSVSRMNFHRLMHSTINVLKNVIGAVEMTVFTKVGENTFPNFIPDFVGISEDDLVKVCYPNRWDPLDDCPFIWKEFAKNKYLTAHLEDSPKMAAFNYLKTGFVEQPMDIYMRPLMLAAYQDKGGFPYTVDCIGYQRPEELILNYVVDLSSIAHKRIPYFITSWMTDLSHDDMNSVMALDELVANTLLKMREKGLLENTILILLSDHGYRFLEIRTTKSGWYEDKMPALWIKLPPSVESAQPTWSKSLEQNSRQLITPYDINFALRDILKAFPATGGKVHKGSPPHLKNIPKIRNISLFQRIPSRTCEEANIPRGYCPCTTPVAYENPDFIKQAARYFLNSVNAKLPFLCMKLKISEIFAFGTTDPSFIASDGKESIDGNTYPETSVMALTLTPGDFLFEVWLKYDNKISNFTEFFDVLRMNQLGGAGSCVESQGYGVEMYCYCKHRFYLLDLVKPITG